MATRYEESFQTASKETGIPTDYLKALATQETNINQINSKQSHALGVLQVIPVHHPALDPERLANDPDYNIRGGSAFLADLIDKTNPNLPYEERFGQALQRYYGSRDPDKNAQYARSVISKIGNAPQIEEPDSYLLPGEEGEYTEWLAKQKPVTQTEEPETYLLPGEETEYKDWLAKQAEAQPPVEAQAPAQEDRTAAQVGSDILTTAGKGIIGIPQALTGLADIPTGGKVGKYLEEKGYDFERMQKELSEQYSPQQKEDIKALEQAKGVSENLKAAWEHPEAVASMVGESIPSMLTGGMLGRAAKAAGAVKSSAAAAGVGEALISGGQSAEDIRVQSPERELSTKGALSALGAGAVTGVLGAAGSKLTTAMGGIDVDTLLVGGARKAIAREVGEEAAKTPGVFRRVLTSTFGEGILEEAPQSAQEKMWQNFATDKPLMDGVEDAATKGAILGAVTGGVAGALPTGKEGVITPSIPSPVVQAPTRTQREEEHAKTIALKKRSSEIEDAGIPVDSKLHDELLSLDYNNLEDLQKAKELVDQAEQTDEYEDLDLENFDNHISQYETKLVEQATAPEAVTTPEVVAQKQQTVTPEVITPEAVAPEPSAEVTTPEAKLTIPEAEETPDWLKRPEAVAPEEQAKVEPEEAPKYSIASDKGDINIDKEFDMDNYPSMSQRVAWYMVKNPDYKPTDIITYDDAVFYKQKDGSYTDDPRGSDHSDMVYDNVFHLNSDAKENDVKLKDITSSGKSSWLRGARELVKKLEPTQQTTKEQILQPANDQTFSVAPNEKSTPYTAELLKKSLTPEMQRLVASGKAVLHDTQATLPGTNHPANVQGMTTAEGVTHYVANKLNPTTLQNVALHETGVHAGMEKMVGDKVWEDVKNQAMTNQGPEFDAARASIPKDTPPHLHAEEALAYLVENSPHLPFIRRLIAAVRNWARTTFGANIRLSQDDARHLATRALRKESKTAQTTARKEGTAFSKEKLLAPNGKPSNLNATQYAQVRTPAFKKWFGDWENDPENASKMLDENGEPKIMYHGTMDKKFYTFDLNAGYSSRTGPKGTVSFASEKSFADRGIRTIDGYINAKKPFDYRNEKDVNKAIEYFKQYNEDMGYGSNISDKEKALREGRYQTLEFDIPLEWYTKNNYDSVYMREAPMHPSLNINVFKPNQIKSASENTGAFSTENADIRYSLTPASEEALAATEQRREEGTPAPRVKTKRGFFQSLKRAGDVIETSLMSYDSAYINGLRRELVKYRSPSGEKLPVKEITQLLLKASQSQTVHASSVAAEGAIRGGLKKNEVTQKWDAVDLEHKMPNVRLMLEDIAKQHGLTYKQVSNQFGDIMVASRIFELRQQPDKIREKIEAATDERIKKNLEKKLKKAVALANNQHLSEAQVQQQLNVLKDQPEYKKPMEEWQKVRKTMIDFLVDTGRYSDAQAKAYLDAIAYVPFNRIMEQKDPDAAYAIMSQGYGKASLGLTKGQTEHGIKGSKREVDDAVTNMEKWVMNSFVKGINASKGRELVDLSLVNMPVGTVTDLGRNPKNKEGAVAIYRDGKKEYYRYADPMMQFAFNGINPIALQELKFGAKFANRLRQTIVLNPLFTISQLPQDTFSAMFSSGLRNPMALPLEVIKEFGKTLASSSATHAKLKGRGVVGQKDFMDSYGKSIHDLAYNQHGEKKGVGASILTALDRFAMVGDNALRQAVYNRTMKELKNRPDADAIATERAFEIINFRRRGASAAADMIRQITPFLGAYLQAQRVAFNTLSGRGISPSQRNEALATLALTTAQVLALTFAYNGLLDDDDEFKKKNAREKDTRLFVMGSKSNVTIPIRPDIFSLPFVMGNHMYREYFDKGTENPEVARRAYRDAFIAMIAGMPMGPTIVKPIVEVAIDHDFFTGRGLVSQKLAGFDKELQYTDGTSEIAKMLGSTGYVSPIAVDHLVKGFFGYAGGAALSVSDIALRASMDLPYASKDVYGKDIYDIPGMSSLYAKENKPQIIDSFFKFNSEVDKVNRTYGEYKKTGRREEAQEYKAEDVNRLLMNDSVRKNLHKMSTDVSELKEKKRKIMETSNERISPEAKRMRVDRIDERLLHTIKNIDRLQNKVYK